MSLRAPVTSSVTFPTTKLSVRMEHIHTCVHSVHAKQKGRSLPAEIYSGLVGTASILSVTRSVLFYYVCVNAAKVLHNRMFGAVLRAPIRFFDTSPIGKELSKLSVYVVLRFVLL